MTFLDRVMFYCHDVVLAVHKQGKGMISYSQAELLVEPLAWYIQTGRAPMPFMRKLIEIRPFLIARRLAKGGSTNEAVERIKEFVEKY